MYKKQIEDLILNYETSKIKENFIPGKTLIPASGKVLDSNEKRNMIEASLEAWLTTGHWNTLFEYKLKQFINTKHILTVNSGSSANLLALSTLTSPELNERTLKPNDEIITLSCSFPTTVNPIVQLGMVPVFIDIEIPSYNINISKIEAAINKKTKAIMIAHTLGNPFNLSKVKEICDKYNLWLIEDCCDALGSTYSNQHVGTFGDIATLSFYPAHHITTGEGGAVFTNNGLLAKIATSMRDWGRDCFCDPGCDNTCNKRFDKQLGDLPLGYDHKYTYSHLGYNLKMTDMQSACGCAQIDKLPDFISKRKQNFKYLYKNLECLEEFLILPKPTLNSNPSWFGFPITLTAKAGNRVDLLKYLDQNKIGTRLLFGGNITKQPYFKDLNYRISGDITNTDIVMNHTFWIGVWPGLTSEMLDYVISMLKEYFQCNTQ